jgi:hypothetical protein
MISPALKYEQLPNHPRRMILALAIALCIFSMHSPVRATAPQHRVQAPGFYRMMLGAYEITVLSDGTHPFPDAEVLIKLKSGVDADHSKLFGLLIDACTFRSQGSDISAFEAGVYAWLPIDLK